MISLFIELSSQFLRRKLGIKFLSNEIYMTLTDLVIHLTDFVIFSGQRRVLPYKMRQITKIYPAKRDGNSLEVSFEESEQRNSKSDFFDSNEIDDRSSSAMNDNVFQQESFSGGSATNNLTSNEEPRSSGDLPMVPEIRVLSSTPVHQPRVITMQRDAVNFENNRNRYLRPPSIDGWVLKIRLKS